MSAIARVLLESGETVSGSDRQLSPLAQGLADSGVQVMIGHRPENILGAEVVVRSSAVGDDNPEVAAALQAGVPVLKRADFLGAWIGPERGRRLVAVAGTHGKTTTTAMVSWLLSALGQDPSYIIGGVSLNLGGNAHASRMPLFVIEADEYDRMFLGLRPEIAVITNIDLDHTEFAGPTIADIAREKVGISKESSTLVVGDVNDALNPIWSGAPSRGLVRRIEHFDCIGNELAIGGRLLDVSTPRGLYRDVMVPLHGRHQGDNASIAIVAVEEFFDAQISEDILREGMSTVEMPGRFEVLGHRPLVIIDGAHNPAGADVCSAVFFDDFSPVGRRILVVGTLKGRDPELTLGALRVDDFDVVVTCTAPSPRGLESAVLAATARSMGCDEVLECTSVEEACAKALSIAGEDDAVLVAGSLYVVGSARTTLRRSL